MSAGWAGRTKEEEDHPSFSANILNGAERNDNTAEIMSGMMPRRQTGREGLLLKQFNAHAFLVVVAN